MPFEQSSPASHPEIDLADVLRGRIAAGEPVYVTGKPKDAVLGAVTSAVNQAAAEVGKPARILQIVELPRLDSLSK